MPNSYKKQTVAVVDSGRAFFSRVKKLLQNTDIQLRWIKSYEKSLNSLIHNECNVYLINFTFSENFGIKLLKKAKKAGSFSPVIIFNEKKDEQIIEAVLDAGASDFISTEITDDNSIKFAILHELKEFQILENLFTSEAKYRNLIESMPIMFYSAQPFPPYRPIHISKAFETLGYPLEDWFNDPEMWRKVLHPDDCEEFLEIAREAKENGKSIDVEYRVITKKGEMRWLRDLGQFVKDQNGEPICWQGAVLDVTGKKEAEYALLESENQYRNLFENANDLLYVHDLDGNYLSLNETAGKIFGYTKEEALCMNIRDTVAPEYLDFARKKIEEKINGYENSTYEIECITKDKNRISLEINSRIIYKDNVPFAVQGIARDISERKKAKQKLIESKERFKDLFENANDLIYTHDLNGQFTSLNTTGEIITGYSRKEIARMSMDEIIAPEFIEKARQMLVRKLEGKQISTYELDVFTKDQRRITLEVSSRLTFENGKPVGVQGIARDVTERNRLIGERDRFYKFSMDLLATVDVSGRLIQINPSWKKTLEYDESELLNSKIFNYVHPEDLKKIISNVEQVKRGKTISVECRVKTKNGSYRWIHWNVVPVHNDSVSYAIGRDITERKMSEQMLEHHAMHDVLTNLPNRAHFYKHLKLATERAKIEPRFRFAVLFLDLDRFKVINDSLGHLIGDKLLIGIAERLKVCVRPSDVIARLGGDEFTILLTIKEESDAILVAERLQEELSAPFKIESYEVFTSASVGILISDDTPRTAEEFLRDADAAMYRAKETGKARYEIFDRDMHVRNKNLLQVETDLRKALERNEFIVFYQPIVSLVTGEIEEFEALIRWNHPEFGLIFPGDFIPIAEETGLIIPIGRWILEESCRQICKWQKKFSGNLAVSVNLSTKQLMNPNLTSQVREILNKTNICPSKLKLEVTESSVMDFSDTAFDVLSELRDLGISLSTDDFGTGYSSLSYLHKYPFQRLKIDRSFVRKIEDKKSAAIIKTIIGLGQNLNIDVVAEGIEEKSQLDKLISIGCRRGQGFLFSKPVDKKSIENLLKDQPNFTKDYDLPESIDGEIMQIENVQ